MSRHIFLVARSVTHHGGHQAVHELAAAVDVGVKACFLDGAQPCLHAALDTPADTDEILLVPAHLPPDRYLDA